MENISQLVESSLARHGVATNFDHLRLQWTNWFRCESSFSVLLAPAKPGIFALGEEIIPAGAAGKRMLGLFEVSEADDLGMALGRLFLPGTPLRERLISGKCFARYAIVEDAGQRRLAAEVFQRWMQDSVDTASGFGWSGADTSVRNAAYAAAADKISNQAGAEPNIPSSKVVEIKPSTSFAWGMEVQEREVEELKPPQPLPSGF